MDQHRFEAMVRRAADGTTRRGIRGLILGSLFAPIVRGRVAAGKRNKRGKNKSKNKSKNKNKKPPFNEFGCLDVGKACNGSDDLCCSGICDGSPPKKGKKDNSRCVAHNAGGCTPERDFCVVDDPLEGGCNPKSEFARCAVTTGTAPFCADFENLGGEEDFCLDCQSDIDCQAFGFAPGVACVLFQGSQLCDTVCPRTGGRACLRPAV